MSDLVTGEAVVLELRLAKLASRSLALAIDLAVQFALLFLSLILLGSLVDSVDDALAAALALVMLLSVILGYPVAMETLTRGRSLGKLALGLRVVREDGGPIRFRHAFLRGLLGVVEIWATFGSVALIASLVSAKGKRVGDVLAHTVVIRERMPAQGAPVAAMPPGLAAWASALELSRLPDDLALAARQYLARARDLAPEVGESMGGELARAVAGVVSPPPPPGVPAWAYLSAVLAERRRRELARMQPPSWPGQQPGWGQPPSWPGQQPGWAPQPYGASPPPPQGWGGPPGWSQGGPYAAAPPQRLPHGERPPYEQSGGDAPPGRDDPFAPPS